MADIKNSDDLMLFLMNLFGEKFPQLRQVVKSFNGEVVDLELRFPSVSPTGQLF